MSEAFTEAPFVRELQAKIDALQLECGSLLKQRDDAIKERDALTAKVNLAYQCMQAKDEAISELQAKCDAALARADLKSAALNDCTDCLKTALARAEAAERACAKMRSALLEIRDTELSTTDPAFGTWNKLAAVTALANNALFTDCGKGFVRASELQPAIKLLKGWHLINMNEVAFHTTEIESELARLTALVEKGSE
jgi:chromosome segregation ATPase